MVWVDPSVLFDGQPVGSHSPFLQTLVTPHTAHRLEISRPGYRTWSQQVNLQADQTLRLEVALTAQTAPRKASAREPAAPGSQGHESAWDGQGSQADQTCRIPH